MTLKTTLINHPKKWIVFRREHRETASLIQERLFRRLTDHVPAQARLRPETADAEFVAVGVRLGPKSSYRAHNSLRRKEFGWKITSANISLLAVILLAV